MINTIIYSYNRAQQLRLLLYSLSVNGSSTDFDISILYKYSTEVFNDGYKKLKNENIYPNIHWIEEVDFKSQTLDLLNSDYEFTTFFTDDDILYKKFDSHLALSTLKNDNEVFVFSCRMGLNIVECYTMNTKNLIVPLEETDKIIKWEWQKHYYDANYPLSLDFHLFRTLEIKKLISKISFFNPNTLEGNLQIFDTYPKTKIASFKHSIMVNSPSNIVNETHPNRYGEQFGISSEELNKRYLGGEIIDFESLSFENIVCPHQEIPFIFKKQNEATPII